jgi:hypothetical protein
VRVHASAHCDVSDSAACENRQQQRFSAPLRFQIYPLEYTALKGSISHHLRCTLPYRVLLATGLAAAQTTVEFEQAQIAVGQVFFV